MKIKLLLIAFSIALFSCKNSNKNTSGEKLKENSTEESKEISVLQKIANAHGYNNWKNIEKLQYTFNVDRDTSHYERSWKWWPKEGKINMMAAKDTVTYTRSKMDSTQVQTDQGFINDKYWLLFPFQLVWDKGFTHNINENVAAPISSKKLTEISINYNDKKGYTPDDTYKIYVNENYIIQEWAFFPKGQDKAALTTTWEDYTTQKGLKIAQMHKNKSGDFQLYFSDLKID